MILKAFVMHLKQRFLSADMLDYASLL